MARTCIICGGGTGSREHVFPASLGGRRENKGIYCKTHNMAYSDLVQILSDQLAIFNAQLGVVGDHADGPTAVSVTDLASGQEIELSAKRSKFKGRQILGEKTEGDQTFTEMSFSTEKEAQDWLAKERAKGVDIKFAGPGRKVNYYLGAAHKRITLGGNEEGMRSIAYIAQTYLAVSFPEIARRPELQALKDYTLLNRGSGFAWWDFDPPTVLPANKFPFGHRVIVGLDAETNTAYARISLFSTLDFAIQLASLPVDASHAVITDIDPLAPHARDDIHIWSDASAVGAVTKPENLSASLAEAIDNGRGQAQIDELMRRIRAFELDKTSARIIADAGEAAAMSAPDREAVFAKILSHETQRILNLVRYAAAGLKDRAIHPDERRFVQFMEAAGAPDPSAENGLTVEATRALGIACSALARQMSEECKAGTLDQRRVAFLLGGTPGAATVCAALLQEFKRTISTRQSGKAFN